jgi:hypothetical protein
VFLGLFLAALDEELVGLYTYIGMRKPASASSVDEETQSAGGQTEVRKRDYSVRHYSFPAVSLTLLTFARTRIGKFSRVAHLTHIRWKVPFDSTRAKPAQSCYSRRLAITPTQHRGPFLLRFSPSTRKFVLVTNLQTLCAARFCTLHSRRTRIHLPAPTRASRSIQLEHGEQNGASRCTSARSRPPS